MSALGDALGVLALAAAGAAAWWTWRQPFIGLGILVAGMAFHNFLVMTLVRLGSSHLLIRVVQSWKEGILLLLIGIAGMRLYAAYREGRLGRPIALDWVAGVYLAVMVMYLLLPSGVLHGYANFQQRLAAFRLASYLPVLYALGRTFQKPTEQEIRTVAWLIVGAAAIVGLFGVYELFFVPTRTWIDWGVNDFSAWLGFRYSGPGHLPENFFQTLPSGLYLRRMASTYLSPLGIAYTGLLVFPIAVLLIDRQQMRSRGALVATMALLLVITGVLFSVTRLALFMLAGEGILLALVMRRRWMVIMAPLLVGSVVALLAVYPQVGPAVDNNLVPGGPDRGSLLTIGDPSFIEHLKTLEADVKVAVHHPLGEGLGSAGSTANRFGTNPGSNPNYAPGESALLTTFVDTGVVGGLAYLVFYLFGLLQAFRALWSAVPSRIALALPMSAAVGGLALVPVMLTNDVWGDLSVLFLYWWAIGFSAALATRNSMSTQEMAT